MYWSFCKLALDKLIVNMDAHINNAVSANR